MKQLLLALCCWYALVARAEGIYQTPDAFLSEVFDGEVPAPAVVWLRGETREVTESILGHRYGSLRIRYWPKDGRSAWILDEIGKEHPITTGIVVEDGRIAQVKVLIFRESRGWEVRHDFFTDQFKQATLHADRRLDQAIDNISGATLSVRALTKQARLALYLAQQVAR